MTIIIIILSKKGSMRYLVIFFNIQTDDAKDDRRTWPMLTPMPHDNYQYEVVVNQMIQVTTSRADVVSSGNSVTFSVILNQP